MASELKYTEVSTLSEPEILSALSAQDGDKTAIMEALFSACYYHDLDFAVGCINRAMQSDDPDHVRAVCELAVLVVQTRGTVPLCDDFLASVTGKKRAFPKYEKDFDRILGDLADFRTRLL